MINEEGEVEYPYLDTYWEDPRRHPYFLMLDQENIGFVLVNDWVLDSEFDAQYSVAEFYVKPAFRRKGIGQRAMQLLWEQYPGRWEIRQQLQNLPAQVFWRSIIQKRVGGYEEKKMQYGVDWLLVQLFEISGNLYSLS